MNIIKNSSLLTISLLLALFCSPIYSMELFDAICQTEHPEYVSRLQALIDACPASERMAFVNQQDISGWTPLHMAARVRCTDEVIQMLVAAGANVNRPDHDGTTPLHQAALYNSYGAAMGLIAAGADVNKKDTRNGRTPLHWATIRGTLVIEALINAGANINQEDNHGDTPLHEVALAGFNIEAAKVLIAAGANISAQNFARSTPLQLAQYRKEHPTESYQFSYVNKIIDLLDAAMAHLPSCPICLQHIIDVERAETPCCHQFICRDDLALVKEQEHKCPLCRSTVGWE